jgi:hypothetical protein
MSHDPIYVREMGDLTPSRFSFMQEHLTPFMDPIYVTPSMRQIYGKWETSTPIYARASTENGST